MALGLGHNRTEASSNWLILSGIDGILDWQIEAVKNCAIGWLK
jgi:hypothetical protein